jgi:rfaE bifunctional protein nucleotidyltransferase chain/domain
VLSNSLGPDARAQRVWRDAPTAAAGSGAEDISRKIVSIERLRDGIARLRSSAPGARPRIVQCHGCFDIVHPGHIRYLQFARSTGDVLVVSITGDATIHKGEQRPYIPEELRAENLAALQFVDFVTIDPHPTAVELLEAIRPDVYVKGHEYAASKDPRFLRERHVVESYGGRVVFSSGQVVFSSSRLGETLARDASMESERLGVLCRRHGMDRVAFFRLLDRFRGMRVLVVGDTLVERYVLCDAGSVASESPMMSLTELDCRDHFGGAAFLAAQAAALGACPVLVTVGANDRMFGDAARALAAAGVEVRCVARREALPIRTRFLVDDQKMFKVDRGAALAMDSVGRRALSEHLDELSSDADCVLLHSCGMGLLDRDVLDRFDRAARERRPFLAAGAAEPFGDLRMMRHVDLLCASERRIRVGLNDFDSGLSTLVYDALQMTQCAQMIVSVAKRGLVTFDRPTHDPRDAKWSDRLRSEYLPCLADRAADRLGCTETMLVTAALSLTCRASLMQAAYVANAASACGALRQGPTAVAADELRQWALRRRELVVPPRTGVSSPIYDDIERRSCVIS